MRDGIVSDDFDGLTENLEDGDIDAVRLQPTRMRWLSAVSKGANRRGWRIFKDDAGDPVVIGDADTSAKRTIVSTIAKNALRLMRAAGGRSEDEVAVKLAAADGSGRATREHVVALAFSEAFTPELAGEWAGAHAFKADAADIEQTDGGLLVHLKQVPAGTDCATVLLAEGVAAVVMKADPPAFASRMHVDETGTLHRRMPPMPTRSLGTNTGANASGDGAFKGEPRVVALIFDRSSFADATAVRKWIEEKGSEVSLAIAQKDAHIDELVSRYRHVENPFTTALGDLMNEGFDEDTARKACGQMKDRMESDGDGADDEDAADESSEGSGKPKPPWLKKKKTDAPVVVKLDASVVEDRAEYFRVPQTADPVAGKTSGVTIAKGVLAVVEGGVETHTIKENDTMTEKALEQIVKKAAERISAELDVRLKPIEAALKLEGETPAGDDAAGEGETVALSEDRVVELIDGAFGRFFGPISEKVSKMEKRLNARIPSRRGSEADEGTGRARKDDDADFGGGLISFGGRAAR
jgi:hypothetical protein